MVVVGCDTEWRLMYLVGPAQAKLLLKIFKHRSTGLEPFVLRVCSARVRLASGVQVVCKWWWENCRITSSPSTANDSALSYTRLASGSKHRFGEVPSPLGVIGMWRWMLSPCSQGSQSRLSVW
jgi:hypothetical protein